MKKEFNPMEYKSYEDLPDERKVDFDAVEGGKDFALKSVEKNPETAHKLAMIYDQTINALRQEIEANDLPLDALLERYSAAAEEYDYKEKRQTAEFLKQISDYEILRGGDYNEQLKEEFKKRYESLTYSEKTQNIFIADIGELDLDVAAKLLKDEKFSNKKDLLDKAGTDSDALKQLYELAKDDLSVVKLIVEHCEDTDMKVDMLKDIVKTGDKLRENYYFESIQRHIGEALVRENKRDLIIQLIDDGYLETSSLKNSFHEINSDQLLYDIAVRSKNKKELAYLFKFIADENVFSRIIGNNGQSLTGLPDSERAEMAVLAKKFLNAITQDLEIHQASDLGEEGNKFVVGIPSESDKLFLAWGNIDVHEYHKDIFQNAEQHFGMDFPKDLRSGGWVEIRRKDIDRLYVKFSRSSGDFGNYSYRVLSLFKENILKSLREKLNNNNIELEIEVSS